MIQKLFIKVLVFLGLVAGAYLYGLQQGKNAEKGKLVKEYENYYNEQKEELIKEISLYQKLFEEKEKSVSQLKKGLSQIKQKQKEGENLSIEINKDSVCEYFTTDRRRLYYHLFGQSSENK